MQFASRQVTCSKGKGEKKARIKLPKQVVAHVFNFACVDIELVDKNALESVHLARRWHFLRDYFDRHLHHRHDVFARRLERLRHVAVADFCACKRNVVASNLSSGHPISTLAKAGCAFVDRGHAV